MNLYGLAPFGVTPSFIVSSDPNGMVQEDSTDVQTDSASYDTTVESFAELAEQEPLTAVETDPHTIVNDKLNFDNLSEEIKSDKTVQPLLKELERVYQLCEAITEKLQTVLQFLQLDDFNYTEQICWNIEWNSSFSMPLDELPSRHQLYKMRNTRDSNFQIIRKTRKQSLFKRTIQVFKRFLPEKFSASIGSSHYTLLNS